MSEMEITIEVEGLEHLRNDYERTEYLQNLLVSFSTGGGGDEVEYKNLRSYFLSNKEYEDLLPDFVRTKRDLNQFWNFIKPKFPTYAERREYLWNEFHHLLTYLETRTENRVSDHIATRDLEVGGAEYVQKEIHKALTRVIEDPEGAITSARSIVEAVCKYIADQRDIKYTDNTELSVLYKDVSKELNLSPEQHSEEIFRQILGGCSAIVNGLGTLRNRYGDAHGKSGRAIKPSARHAELAVTLAGSMAIFLIETHKANT